MSCSLTPIEQYISFRNHLYGMKAKLQRTDCKANQSMILSDCIVEMRQLQYDSNMPETTILATWVATKAHLAEIKMIQYDEFVNYVSKKISEVEKTIIDTLTSHLVQQEKMDDVFSKIIFIIYDALNEDIPHDIK